MVLSSSHPRPEVNETVLYLVSSPFQIVGCSEFRDATVNQHFSWLPPLDANHVLVIKSSGQHIERNQFKQTCSALGWQDPIWLSSSNDCPARKVLPLSVTVMLRQIREVRRLVREYAPRTVVSGSVSNPVPEAALMSATQRVIVDDGLSVALAVRRRPLRLQNLISLRSRARNEATKRIARVLSGQFRFRFSRTPLHWFSGYELRPIKNDRTTKHDFVVIRDRLGTDFEQRISDDVVLFVAPPDGKFSLAMQLMALDRVRACNPSAELVYAPHRGTSRRTLSAVASRGILIRESRTTLELDLASYPALPGRIFGFQSTVLANVLQISRVWEVFDVVFLNQSSTSKRLTLNDYNTLRKFLANMGCKTLYIAAN